MQANNDIKIKTLILSLIVLNASAVPTSSLTTSKIGFNFPS